MFDAVLGAVLLRVVRDLEGDPDARGRDQQAKGEAVAFLENDLLLVVATVLDRPPRAVACAVGVLGLLSRLADQRGIDQEQKLSSAAFARQ